MSFSLDKRCCVRFTYRDLIACSSTLRALVPRAEVPGTDIPQEYLPQQPGTSEAMEDLGVHLLDPLAARFKKLTLTYGFASQALTRQIKGRIAPALDQHAGWEVRSDGRPICDRLGLAVDLRVPEVSSVEVARWVWAELPFDRLYFYGPKSAVHLSFGPQHSRSAWDLTHRVGQRRVPRRLRL